MQDADKTVTEGIFNGGKIGKRIISKYETSSFNILRFVFFYENAF